MALSHSPWGSPDPTLSTISLRQILICFTTTIICFTGHVSVPLFVAKHTLSFFLAIQEQFPLKIIESVFISCRNIQKVAKNYNKHLFFFWVGRGGGSNISQNRISINQI